MSILPTLLILVGVGFISLAYGPIIKDEIWYQWKQFRQQTFTVADTKNNNTAGNFQKDSVFARFISTKPINITPVNTDFSIVIEKIGVNAPVVRDINVTDEKRYLEALKGGVAHSSVSGYPSTKPGNVYLFAHASSNFWQLGQYATVFNLLRKLDVGDRVHVFYEGSVYVYEVINKTTYDGWNTYPLTRAVIEPILTLQTCDPPGTTINRLVVTAKLVESKKLSNSNRI